MCVATPMRVLAVHDFTARCVDRQGAEATVDLRLVGSVEPDAWVLVFLGAAREILDAARAGEIDRALDALDAALRGDASAIDAAFADLVGREPQLPDFLR